MKTRSMYKAERMSLDRISTLPELILETIICLLPTIEAARTSILSREWRYKWTRIPELNFNVCKRTSELTSDITSTRKYMDMHDLHQVLLRRQGPIHKLTLWMADYEQDYDFSEFDQIILHLSRNHTVKELTIYGSESENIWYKLPISVFSLHHLTYLYLWDFDLDHPPIFNGFGSLSSLDFTDVKICTKTLLHLLSNCPSLKNLRLHIAESDDIGESDDKCTINELFKCLPVIEHLSMTTMGKGVQWLVLDPVPQELPTSLIHLRYFCLDGTDYIEDYELAFVLVLIRCSPNLESIVLQVEWDLSGYMEYPIVQEYYQDVWLEHLNLLDIFFSRDSQLEFVKFILANSPKLKTLSMFGMFEEERESNILKTLTGVPLASPSVTISILRYGARHTSSYLLYYDEPYQ